MNDFVRNPQDDPEMPTIHDPLVRITSPEPLTESALRTTGPDRVKSKLSISNIVIPRISCRYTTTNRAVMVRNIVRQILNSLARCAPGVLQESADRGVALESLDLLAGDLLAVVVEAVGVDVGDIFDELGCYIFVVDEAAGCASFAVDAFRGDGGEEGGEDYEDAWFAESHDSRG